MPLTILNAPGDATFISTILLPDSGTAITATGALNPNTATEVAFTNTSLVSPAAPASGSIYWLIEVNTTTGALDILQSTVALPANTAGCVTIFQQTLTTGQTNPAAVSTNVTPDI